VADDALFTIAGQEFKVTSKDRVFYATGTTKSDVSRKGCLVRRRIRSGPPFAAEDKCCADGDDGAFDAAGHVDPVRA
jgi:methylglyoxal synthase